MRARCTYFNTQFATSCPHLLFWIIKKMSRANISGSKKDDSGTNLTNQRKIFFFCKLEILVALHLKNEFPVRATRAINIDNKIWKLKFESSCYAIIITTFVANGDVAAFNTQRNDKLCLKMSFLIARNRNLFFFILANYVYIWNITSVNWVWELWTLKCYVWLRISDVCSLTFNTL